MIVKIKCVIFKGFYSKKKFTLKNQTYKKCTKIGDKLYKQLDKLIELYFNGHIKHKNVAEDNKDLFNKVLNALFYNIYTLWIFLIY